MNYEPMNESFDLIFLDPPFHEGLLKKSIEIITKYNLLKKEGYLYIECESELAIEPIAAGLQQLKASKGGETKFYLYAS